ncbi:hypothetical protein, partial [Bradyrhizobium elkanii]|uniref:hypothetical protein n=1 Tax=Bradyrhizobium elkanii TaxID=29448 RepID=UPI002FF0EA8C
MLAENTSGVKEVTIILLRRRFSATTWNAGRLKAASDRIEESKHGNEYAACRHSRLSHLAIFALVLAVLIAARALASGTRREWSQHTRCLSR